MPGETWCRSCNDQKKGGAWREFLRALHPDARLRRQAERRIESFIDELHYAPDTTELRSVAQKLYELVDTQTRALLDFADRRLEANGSLTQRYASATKRYSTRASRSAQPRSVRSFGGTRPSSRTSFPVAVSNVKKMGSMARA